MIKLISGTKTKKGLIVASRLDEKKYTKDFLDVFPDLKQPDINNILQELKRDGKVIHIGTRISGYWTLK